MKHIETMKELSISRIEFIQKLPEDILKKIYLDHFKVVFEYDRIMKCIPNMYTRCSHPIMIRHMMRILDNKTLLQYFIKHNKYFAGVYYDNIEPNIKSFVNIDNIIVSHIMCWMLRTYH